MHKYNKSRKSLAIILSVIMVVLTLNVSTVSAHSDELSDNIQIADTAQVNIVDENGNVIEQTTTQGTTVPETQPFTEKETQQATEKETQQMTEKEIQSGTAKETQPSTQEATEIATVDVSKDASNTTLNITLGSIVFQSNGSDLQYKQGTGKWTTYTDGVKISSNTSESTENTITVLSGSHNITLSGVNIDVSKKDNYCAFDIQETSNATITLAKDSINVLKSGKEKAGIQVETKDGNTASVTIEGSGELTTTGGALAAGIGAGYQKNAGTIMVSGNVQIKANGISGGAGIGGGHSGHGGMTTIKDGANVTASSNDNAAGIGGGIFSDGGTILISGQDTIVKSTGGWTAAGIGGGRDGDGGQVTIIDNAQVTAVAGLYGAGIGGGGAFNGQTPTSKGADIIMDNSAKVIATSRALNRPALHDENSSISTYNNSQTANILQLNRENSSLINDTSIYYGNELVSNYKSEFLTYISIAFSGLDTGKAYTVEFDNEIQQGVKSGDFYNEFTLNNGLNIYTSVKSIKSLDIANGSISFKSSGSNLQYKQGSGAWTTYTSDIIITGTTSENNVIVESGTHNITLSNLNIDFTQKDDNCAFDIQGSSNVTLTLSGNVPSVLKSGSNNAGIQVKNTNGNTARLTIQGRGELQATGGVSASGIGGGRNTGTGEITINSGTITANTDTSFGASGIGGGSSSSVGSIVINGGEITATGRFGAGIGGGNKGTGANITINGGTINASSTAGAGIGTGDEGSIGNITIGSNANVTAKGGTNAAGIGSAENGTVGTITIKDIATVKSQGGYKAAGIGSGEFGESSTVIIRDDAIITATGGNSGAGIGTGQTAKIATITIRDNATVTAKGGEYAAGVGGGNRVAGGNITIRDNVTLTAIGGSIVNNTAYYPSAIGSGGYLKTTTKPDSATLAIGADVKLTAVARGIEIFAIDAKNGEITNPSGQAAANMLQLNYQSIVKAGTKTELLSNNKIVDSVIPDVAYQSVAFSGLEKDKEYRVKLGTLYQEGIKDGDNIASTDLKLNNTGNITTYNNVKLTSQLQNPEFDIADSSLYFRIEGNNKQYSLDNVEWINYLGEVTITGKSYETVVTVINGEHDITLNNATIGGATYNSDKISFHIQGDSIVNLTLAENSENSIVSNEYGKAALQVESKDGKTATVNIKGKGELGVYAGYTGACIGGSASIDENGNDIGVDAGNINIGEDVTINIRANPFGAGIGGGYYGSGGTITINGNAKIEAYGGQQGAGIGGGKFGDGGTITIGGNAYVETMGGKNGPGIGCGEGEARDNRTYGGIITITDSATVLAKGNEEGNGIGAGLYGSSGKITISKNATVTARGGLVRGGYDQTFGSAAIGSVLVDGDSISIGKDAKVIAVSNAFPAKDTDGAINNNGTTILAPDGEEPANLLALAFSDHYDEGAEIIIYEGSSEVFKYSPTLRLFTEVTFSGFDKNKIYTVKLDNQILEGDKIISTDESLEPSNEFVVDSELNTTVYSLVKPMTLRLNISEDNIYLRENESNVKQYSRDNIHWYEYTGSVDVSTDYDITYIDGTDNIKRSVPKKTTNTITVQNGVHSINLGYIDMDLSEIDNASPIDIQGNSTVNLTIVSRTGATLRGGKNNPAILVQSDSENSATLNINAYDFYSNKYKLIAYGGESAAAIGGKNGSNAGKISIDGDVDLEAIGGTGGAGIGSGKNSSSGSSEITVNGNTHLKATGGTGGAGIGGGENSSNSSNTVVINGNTVIEATGATGIGSGKNSSFGSITIKGDAVVNATGKIDGAGIGSGVSGTFSGITIDENANVTANGGTNSAGIGGSSSSIEDGILIISGTVIANGGSDGAGIGGSNGSVVDKISISGGTVTANGGTNGAGIGGYNESTVGTVSVSGGTVKANGGTNGAGIGGSYGSSGGIITLSGDASVMATGGNIEVDSYSYPSAIGNGGYDSDNQNNPDGATLSIGVNAIVTAIAQGDVRAVNAINNEILLPEGETVANNILQLNYKELIEANIETIVLDGVTTVISAKPEIKYQSIAFSITDKTKTYSVEKEAAIQQGVDKDDTTIHKFNLASGLNNYTSVTDVTTVIDPTLKINESNFYFRVNNGIKQYSETNTAWINYIGTVTIEQNNITDSTQNTITVISGEHDITLNGVNIDVSTKDDYCAFDIQGTSNVTLTLAQDSINTLKSGSDKAGLEVELKNNELASVKIQGSGELISNGGNYGAGIGSGVQGITASDAGIITISENAKVTAYGGPSGSGIGGGVFGEGGRITISENANVTAIGGDRDDQRSSYPSAIGSGSYSINAGNKRNGADLSIGSNATVTAVSQNFSMSAIDTIDNIIKAPENEDATNILQLNYLFPLSANTETAVFDNETKVASFTPDNEYRSIAFSGVDNTTQFNVYTIAMGETEKILQKGEKGSSTEYITAFVADDVNNFTVYNDIKEQQIETTPTININDGSIKLRTNSTNDTQYILGYSEWITYIDEITIEGIANTETTNTITVESGTHNITLSNVNINVANTGGSETLKGGESAFDIQGNSSVVLTLAEGSTNILKSGVLKAGLQVQTKDSKTASIEIKGSGALQATGGKHGAGIGGGTADFGENEVSSGGTITISDTATVTATGGEDGAGIGGGHRSDGGTITIRDTATVTATGGVDGAGIGGGAAGSGEVITISDTATVTATGGNLGAGIGGGNFGKGGRIIISDNANVTAIGGDRPDRFYNYPSAIGSGGYYNTSTKLEGANLSIGSNVKIIAVARGVEIPAIDTLGEISAPENEVVANILQLNYLEQVEANVKTAVLDGNTSVASFAPGVSYQSIAFSGLEANKNYSVVTNNTVQQGQKDDSLTNEFIISSQLTTYTNVQATEEKLNLVTYVNTDGEVLAEEYVVTGETAPRPVLPQLRTEEYIQDFEDSALENITTDTTLVYKKVPKMVEVTASLEYLDKLDITVDNASVDTEVVYGKIVKATYTGEGSVIGWKINEHVVSVTNSKTYAFYIVETSIIEPILEGTAIEEVDINVGTPSYSTEADNKTKAYYPIVAAGYHDATEVKYGVIRSTVESDVTEENIKEYLADTTQQANSNIVREYTETNVMNGDGRYNYVAVMPTDTDKTLYVKAWIEVDGVLYVSELPKQ